MAMLDATVVNVALPALGEDLGAGIDGLQWTLNGYTLTLASFILLGGSLGDRFGRRRLFVIGTVWFAAASLLCGLSPSVEMLVAARALQGVGGALLTPGSLAVIAALFEGEERGRAIGIWSALGGLAGAIGPFAGGWLIASVGWRWVFFVNLPLAAVVVYVALRHVPETADPHASRSVDAVGAALCVIGLAGLTYALVEAGGGASAWSLAAGAIGVGALVAFLLYERRTREPMLSLELFASRQFTAANAVTFLIYAGLGGVFFLLVMQLQIVSGFSPLGAGAALLPVTGLLLLLSGPAGALAERIGPRLPMTIGPLLSALGVALLVRVGERADYTSDVLPAVGLFGLGLALTVAPLTTAVLAAVEPRVAGIGSGVNNAVARTASLVAVAILPLLAGLHGEDYQRPDAFAAGFRVAMLVCAGLLALGGLAALLAIRNPQRASARDRVTASPAERLHCPVAGPALQPRDLSLRSQESPGR
jgi:EmrB/QacA subfamily drug resistance transporter